jgi:hypothetical protein
MKRLFVLSILISFAMVSSCQKQSSTAEQQLAQRKTDLDAREKALDEREKALAEREKAITTARRLPAAPAPQVRPLSPDAAQLKAEREKRIQQLPAEVQAQGLIADPDKIKAERDTRIQERMAQRQRRMEELQARRMGHAVARPATEATSPSPSPSPTPTPQ